MIKSISFITLLFLNFCIGFGQQIIHLSYLPEYPGLEDTITVHYGISYNNYGCAQDSIHVEHLFFQQYAVSSYT